MGEKRLFARNLVSVCINDNQNGDYQGQMWHPFSDDPIDFNGIIDLLVLLDKLLDEWDFPQRSLDRRTFDGREKQKRHKGIVIDKVEEANGVRNVQNRSGKLATFIVQVKFRQNATWQGVVLNKESGEDTEFESAMELLRIIDEDIQSDL